MNRMLAVFALLAGSALAQPPAPAPGSPPVPRATCVDCGTVTSIRGITREEAPPTSDDTKPSGLVASIPLGGGKPKVGSSTKVGREAPARVTTWEAVVRLDDGRFRVLMLEQQPAVQKGDRVRIVEGKLLPQAN
jgi:hypothetical protein